MERAGTRATRLPGGCALRCVLWLFGVLVDACVFAWECVGARERGAGPRRADADRRGARSSAASSASAIARRALLPRSPHSLPKSDHNTHLRRRVPSTDQHTAHDLSHRPTDKPARSAHPVCGTTRTRRESLSRAPDSLLARATQQPVSSSPARSSRPGKGARRRRDQQRARAAARRRARRRAPPPARRTRKNTEQHHHGQRPVHRPRRARLGLRAADDLHHPHEAHHAVRARGAFFRRPDVALAARHGAPPPNSVAPRRVRRSPPCRKTPPPSTLTKPNQKQNN